MRFLSIIILLLISVPAPLLAVEIRWRPAARVQGEQMTLGDLADIRADAATREYLAAIVFGPAPLPGRDLSIDTSTVRQRLLTAYPQLTGAEFSGSDQIQIHRAGRLLTDGQIRDIIRSELKQKARNYPGIRIELHNLQTPGNLVLPEGKLTTRAHLVGADLPTCRSVIIDVSVDGRRVRRLTVPVDIRATAKVVAAIRDLPRGAILARNDLTLVDHELAGLYRPFYRFDDLVGKKLRRAARRAQVLQADMVTTPPVVKRGQPVTIALATGAVRIEARGVARRDGRPGETIPVTNISSRKIVLCRVTGPGSVKVEY